MSAFNVLPSGFSVGAAFSWKGPEGVLFEGCRVYGLGLDGQILEYAWDNGSWSGPRELPAKASPGSSLAVTFQEDSNGRHVRLYFHDQAGRLRELCYDNGWSLGVAFNFPG